MKAPIELLDVRTRAAEAKAKIIRALTCAAGDHEPGGAGPVYLDIQSNMHGEVHCAVCRHCRVVYVRKRQE